MSQALVLRLGLCRRCSRPCAYFASKGSPCSWSSRTSTRHSSWPTRATCSKPDGLSCQAPASSCSPTPWCAALTWVLRRADVTRVPYTSGTFMFDKTVLENGLRIVSSTLPHTRSVSINIFIGAGSRYESDDIAGVSHFLEHMLFKGTTRRPTAREISEEIEGIGGIMNAGTDKELTVYWAKVGDHRFAATLDILADSLLNSLLEAQELEKERQVILEELAMTEDSPADLVNILHDEVVWPHQPLGRDTGGRPDSATATKRDQIIRYMEQLYVPQNTVVAVAGNVTHAEVVDPSKLDEALRATIEELTKMVDGVPEKELTKAKEFIKGRLQLRMEDTRAVASWLGGQELLRREILTVDEVLEIVDDVSAESLQRVASELWRTEAFRLAVVGPFRSQPRV